MAIKDTVVIADGIIPIQYNTYLYDAGVAAIFGPGSSVATAGEKIMEILMEVYGE